MNALFVLPLAGLVLAAPAESRPQEAIEEYQALAKVIRLFMSLVTWPQTGDKPMRVIIVGRTGFKTELDETLGRTTVGGRKVTLQYMTRLAYLAERPECEALFVDREEEAHASAILAPAQGRPTLTMGYFGGQQKQGLMVNFYFEANRIHFEVNPGRIKEAGLAVSSHLLSIAKIVNG